MYLFDSSVIIDLWKGDDRLADLYGDETILTIDLAYGECYYYSIKHKLPLKEIENFNFRIISYSLEDIKRAMHLLHAVKKRTKDFSFIDAVLHTVAEKNKLMLLTKDKDFKGLPNTELVDS